MNCVVISTILSELYMFHNIVLYSTNGKKIGKRKERSPQLRLWSKKEENAALYRKQRQHANKKFAHDQEVIDRAEHMKRQSRGVLIQVLQKMTHNQEMLARTKYMRGQQGGILILVLKMTA